MGAQRRIKRRFAHPKAGFGLEPLARLIDQVDDGYRGPANPRGKHHDVVEIRLPRRIKYRKPEALLGARVRTDDAGLSCEVPSVT